MRHETGSVGTTPALIPASSGAVIARVVIENPNASKALEVSFDGGSGWFEIAAGVSFETDVKGRLTQFRLRGSAANTAYNALLLLEPS